MVRLCDQTVVRSAIDLEHRRALGIYALSESQWHEEHGSRHSGSKRLGMNHFERVRCVAMDLQVSSKKLLVLHAMGAVALQDRVSTSHWPRRGWKSDVARATNPTPTTPQGSKAPTKASFHVVHAKAITILLRYPVLHILSNTNHTYSQTWRRHYQPS